jgi:hypothetical protein
MTRNVLNTNVLNTMMIALLAGGSAAVHAQATPPGPPATPPGQLDRTVAISAATIEAIPRDEEITLMSAELRTVARSGLLIQLAAECGLWSEAADDPTDPENPDDPADPVDDQQPADAPSGRLLVWVELDGEPVEFGPGTVELPEDAARVAFCAGRAEPVALPDEDDDGIPDDGIAPDPQENEPFLQVRQAAAFNWAVDSLPNGANLVEVKATFVLDVDAPPADDDEVGDDDTATTLAQAAIGKRTLVIQPLRVGL